MISEKTVFEIHRLRDEGHSFRAIAGILGISRESAAGYHKNPQRCLKKRQPKRSKLDGYTDFIDTCVEEFPSVSAVVMLNKLKAKGFDGKISIVRDYLRRQRGHQKVKRAFIRFESAPGFQMQVDWGHFGTIDYQGDQRKLYGLAVIESYSRKLYVTFTHSQKQETLHQGLFDAFRFFGGTPTELVVDNMLTAVTERCGRIVGFNDALTKPSWKNAACSHCRRW
jgi:transposase